jgi:hypothetical protein
MTRGYQRRTFQAGLSRGDKFPPAKRAAYVGWGPRPRSIILERITTYRDGVLVIFPDETGRRARLCPCDSH